MAGDGHRDSGADVDAIEAEDGKFWNAIQGVSGSPLRGEEAREGKDAVDANLAERGVNRNGVANADLEAAERAVGERIGEGRPRG